MKKYFLCLLMIVSLFAGAQLPTNAKKNITPNKNIPNGKLPVQQIQVSQITVTPSTVTDLCPWQKTAGTDHDFANNSVRVAVNINYAIDRTSDSTKLIVNIAISGTENGGDRSSVKGNWQKTVYTAPDGWKIRTLVTEVRDWVTYFEFDTDMSIAPDYDACKQRVYSFTKNNFGFHPDPKILKNIEIMTHVTRDDTSHRSGDDFDEYEGTCNCGFKVKTVSFKPVQITLVKK